MTEEEQWAKVKLVKEIAEEVWEQTKVWKTRLFYLKFRILYFTQKDTTFNIYGIKHILITTYTT